MSTNRDTHRLAHAVIDLIADRRMTNAKPDNPVAYRRKVRSDVRGQHWKTLVAICDSDTRTAAIADLLEATDPSTRHDPLDAAQRARDAIAQRDMNRAIGLVECETCDDTGIAMTDDGAVQCDHETPDNVRNIG